MGRRQAAFEALLAATLARMGVPVLLHVGLYLQGLVFHCRPEALMGFRELAKGLIGFCTSSPSHLFDLFTAAIDLTVLRNTHVGKVIKVVGAMKFTYHLML